MLTATRRAIRNLRQQDDGITLVELLVVMVLASVVGAMTLLLFNGASSASNITGDRLNGSAAARNVLQSWQSLVQVAAYAPPATLPAGTSDPSVLFCPSSNSGHRFEWVNATDILFYANVGNLQNTSGLCRPPQLIWLAERDGALLEAHYDFTAPGTWNRSVCRTLTLGSHAWVDEAKSPAVFTAFLAAGTSLSDVSATLSGPDPFAGATSCATAPAAVSAGQVLNIGDASASLLNQVSSIGISFTVTDETGRHSQTFEARAATYGGSS